MKTTIVAHLGSRHGCIRVNSQRIEMDLFPDLHGYTILIQHRELLLGRIPLPFVRKHPRIPLDTRDPLEASKLLRARFYRMLDKVEAIYLPGMEKEDGSGN